MTAPRQRRASFGSFLAAATFIYSTGLYGARLQRLPASRRWLVLWTE